MPSRTFALEPRGPKRLAVSWKRGWRDLEVKLDARPLLTIPTSKELKDGREVQVAAGQVLKVQLRQTFFGSDLLISLNGRPVPGTGPEARLATAYGTIYFIGGLSVVIGVLTELVSVQVLQQLGFGWASIAEGAIFLGLGLWVHKRRSFVGLTLAVGLFALDTVIGAVTVASQTGGSPPTGAMVVRILFLVYMARGFGAIKDLRDGEKAAANSARAARSGSAPR